jgi:hypothetical protein
LPHHRFLLRLRLLSPLSLSLSLLLLLLSLLLLLLLLLLPELLLLVPLLLLPPLSLLTPAALRAASSAARRSAMMRGICTQQAQQQISLSVSSCNSWITAQSDVQTAQQEQLFRLDTQHLREWISSRCHRHSV